MFYIDADCLVVSSTVNDALKMMIQKPDMDIAAAPDVFPPDHFNAGVMVIRPSMRTFRKLLAMS